MDWLATIPTMAPEPLVSGPSSPLPSGAGLVISVVALVALAAVLLGGRRRFRPPRFVDQESPGSARAVEDIWGQAVDLCQSLATDQQAARSIEAALNRLRARPGVDPHLAQDIRAIEDAATRLRSSLTWSANQAGQVANRLNGP